MKNTYLFDLNYKRDIFLLISKNKLDKIWFFFSMISSIFFSLLKFTKIIDKKFVLFCAFNREREREKLAQDYNVEILKKINAIKSEQFMFSNEPNALLVVVMAVTLVMGWVVADPSTSNVNDVFKLPTKILKSPAS